MAPLHPMKVARPERQRSVPDDVRARLRAYSRLGLALALVWLVVNRPFWRHVFMALSAMLFAAVLLPEEMLFFVRHPLLLVALPFAAGFVAVNWGRSSIGTVVACIVLAVLAVAIYRSLQADPVTSTWLWLTIDASDSHAGSLLVDGPNPSSTTTSGESPRKNVGNQTFEADSRFVAPDELADSGTEIDMSRLRVHKWAPLLLDLIFHQRLEKKLALCPPVHFWQ